MKASFVIPAQAGIQPKRKNWVPAFAGMTMLFIASAAFAQDKQPPYWASIASGQAMTRNGPARTYPGKWLYQRRDLPVRVLKKYENWRLIQDPDGEKGWMLVTLLSDKRTAMIKPGDPRPIHSKADERSPVRYRAEAGVVGHIDHCNGGWCHISIGSREGYVEEGNLWGVDPNEVLD
jgi:SH3-like domain-containing protein